jgi:hypothetical protein
MLSSSVRAFNPPFLPCPLCHHSSSLLPRQSNEIQRRILDLLTLGNSQPHHSSKHRIRARHYRRGGIERPPAVVLGPLKLARGVGRAHLLLRNDGDAIEGDADVGWPGVVDAGVI